MNETDLENELRALRPAAPSPELVRGLAAALESHANPTPVRAGWSLLLRWWTERLLWAGGGAVATACVVAMVHPPASMKMAEARSKSPSAPPTAAAAPVSEETLAWKDEGVQFIGGQIPARLLRRVALEQRRSEDGTMKQVPREDVLVVPAVLR